MAMLNRKGPLPLYYQIAENLRAIYKDSDPGTRIASEPELAKMYKVSRGTIKQALDELELEGLVERIRGIGTFTTQPRIQQPGNKIQSYTDQIAQRGYETSARVLNLQKVKAEQRIAERLNLALGDEIYYIERLRYIGNDPMVLISSYVPAALVGNLSEIDVADSLYATLEKRGLRPTKTQDSFMAKIVSRTVAQILNIPEGSAVLYSDRVGFVNGHAIEYSRSIIRGKDYVLTIESDEESSGSIVHRRGFSLGNQEIIS